MFWKAYRRSSIGLRWLIQGAVHDLVRRIERNPSTFKRDYDRLATDNSILEVPVSHQHRMLVVFERGNLDLIAVGGHEVVPQFSQRTGKDRGFGNLSTAPQDFWPIEGRANSLFLSDPDLTLERYGPEFDPEWAYFLAPEQAYAADLMFERYEKLKPFTPALFVLIGGPGTGKTAILLKLLADFHDYSEYLGIQRIEFRCTSQLAKYIDASLPVLGIENYRVQTYPRAHVLLVDDPPDLRALGQAFGSAGGASGYRAVVIGVDPQQLNEAVSDRDFANLLARFKAERLELNCCYRQKAKVGKAARAAAEVIARSTPFLDAGKIKAFHDEHRNLGKLANSLSYPNPRGYVQTYPNARKGHLAQELERIKGFPAWRHWPGALAFMDDGVKLPAAWMRLLEEAGVQIVERARIQSIKGLEYQHVLLFLHGDTYVNVHEGFAGAGRALYASARLLRIPYSRAKDSLVVFVMAGS
jgi:hypothetical protein